MTRDEELRSLRDLASASIGRGVNADVVIARIDAILNLPALPWVSAEEWPPTEADAIDGEVLWWGGSPSQMSPGPLDWFGSEGLTHWLPLSAVPQPGDPNA